jgi:hypothetical protein
VEILSFQCNNFAQFALQLLEECKKALRKRLACAKLTTVRCPPLTDYAIGLKCSGN